MLLSAWGYSVLSSFLQCRATARAKAGVSWCNGYICLLFVAWLFLAELLSCCGGLSGCVSLVWEVVFLACGLGRWRIKQAVCKCSCLAKVLPYLVMQCWKLFVSHSCSPLIS